MSDLMNGLIEAALCASEAILDIYETGFDVEIKSDDSPVTKADQAAEAIILEHLSRLAPNIPVVAEEAVATGCVPEIGQEFFLVDPLDGTKEFVKKNGEFTVNIALIRDELPIMGVIFTPVKGWLYAGVAGKGSWRGDVVDPRISHEITGWHKIKVREPREELDVVGSRSHNTPETEEFLEAFSVRTKTPIGSSLKFCLLASEKPTFTLALAAQWNGTLPLVTPFSLRLVERWLHLKAIALNMARLFRMMLPSPTRSLLQGIVR